MDITQRAEDLGKEVKEKSAVVVDDVVAKGTEAYNNIKDAAAEKITELKNRKDDLDIEVEVILDDLEEKLEDLAEKAEAAAEELCCEEDEE